MRADMPLSILACFLAYQSVCVCVQKAHVETAATCLRQKRIIEAEEARMRGRVTRGARLSALIPPAQPS